MLCTVVLHSLCCTRYAAPLCGIVVPGGRAAAAVAAAALLSLLLLLPPLLPVPCLNLRFPLSFESYPEKTPLFPLSFPHLYCVSSLLCERDFLSKWWRRFRARPPSNFGRAGLAS